jgi:hypothetical protein
MQIIPNNTKLKAVYTHLGIVFASDKPMKRPKLFLNPPQLQIRGRLWLFVSLLLSQQTRHVNLSEEAEMAAEKAYP